MVPCNSKTTTVFSMLCYLELTENTQGAHPDTLEQTRCLVGPTNSVRYQGILRILEHRDLEQVRRWLPAFCLLVLAYLLQVGAHPFTQHPAFTFSQNKYILDDP